MIYRRLSLSLENAAHAYAEVNAWHGLRAITRVLWEQITMGGDLKKFRPRKALMVLTNPEKPSYLKAWALASLLVWAVLDQSPGLGSLKRRGNGPPRRKIRTTSAKTAGVFTIAYILDQQFKRADYGVNRDLMPLVNFFFDIGGLLSCIDSHGAQGILEDISVDVVQKEIPYVYYIVEYLCKYEISYDGRRSSYRTIGAAQEFTRKCAPDGDKTYESSKIQQIWLEYKSAAPYIYAFYPLFRLYYRRTSKQYSGKKDVKIADIFEFIRRVASKQRVISRMVGHVSYAAHLLHATKARDVRINDFKDVPAVPPCIRSFSKEERDLLENYQPDSQIG